MLDANIKLLAIEASVPEKTEDISEVLLIKERQIYVFDDTRIYSELDESTFSDQNSNNGYGMLKAEFVVSNNVVRESYPEFYTKCFVIRTDTGARIKPMKMSDRPTCSKINQKGELVIGIRYFFRNKEEIKYLAECKSILVEGFIALGNVKNVFGIMCQLKKDEKWEISSAYTYKPRNAKNIKNLMD